MHTQETIDLFIEKRVRGVSLQKIADEIGVSKTTLVAWSQKYAADIIVALQDKGLEQNSRANEIFEGRMAKLAEAQSRLEKLINYTTEDLRKLPILKRFRLYFLIQREHFHLQNLRIKNDLAAAKLIRLPFRKQELPSETEPDQNPERSNNGQISGNAAPLAKVVDCTKSRVSPTVKLPDNQDRGSSGSLGLSPNSKVATQGA